MITIKKISEFLNQKLHLSASQIIAGAAAVILGLVLLIAPGVAVSLVFNGVGAICIAIGAFNLIRYFALEVKASILSNALAAGILLIIGGLAIILFKDGLMSIIPVFFGVAILIAGVGKLQGALNLRRMNAGRWYVELIFAAISTIFGALILLNPFSTALLLMRVIGGALLIEGISSLISISAVEKKKCEYFIEVEMKDTE